MRSNIALFFLFLCLSLNLLLYNKLSADINVLGMTFGKTTEESAKNRYPEMIKLRQNKLLDGTIYEIDSKTFGFDGVKKIYILFDKRKSLIAMLLINKPGNFGLINATLSKKYKVILNYKTLIGSRYIEMYHDSVYIYLISSFFLPTSSSLYIKEDIRDKILGDAANLLI